MDNVLSHVDFMYAAAHHLVMYDPDYDWCFKIVEIQSKFVICYVIDDDDYIVKTFAYDFVEFSRMCYVMLSPITIRSCINPRYMSWIEV